jgi:hypothetical protein
VSALRSAPTSSGDKWNRGGDRDRSSGNDRGGDRDRDRNTNNDRRNDGNGARRYNGTGNNERRGDGFYRSSAAQRPEPVIVVSPTAGAMPSGRSAILSPNSGAAAGLRFAHEASIAVYTKEQLLALCLPTYIRPEDLADVPGVTTDKFFAPVNLQTPSPEETVLCYFEFIVTDHKHILIHSWLHLVVYGIGIQ